jgi:hypothetical protein
MLLGQVTRTIVAASLLFACSHSAPPPTSASSSAPLDANYLTVYPEVTVSRTAQEAELKQAAIDPNEDVMAEILAIPPGH